MTVTGLPVREAVRDVFSFMVLQNRPVFPAPVQVTAASVLRVRLTAPLFKVSIMPPMVEAPVSVTDHVPVSVPSATIPASSGALPVFES